MVDFLKLRVSLAFAKANFNRFPAGSSKGGQFAPKGVSGGGASPGSGLFGNTFVETGWAGSGMWDKPKAPPPGSKPHPKLNDKGKPVTVNYPTKPSDPSTWKDPAATATFTPGGAAPANLNGVPMKPWKPPTEPQGWASVAGQNPKLDDTDFVPTRGKSVGTGVIIVEPDGRTWLTKPTNEFGGYAHTYPKGTLEAGLSMQANAIKEAWEETGLKVEIIGVLGDYERDTSKARMYFARRVGGTPTEMGWETQAMRLAPPSKALQLLNRKHDKDIFQDFRDEMSIGKSKEAPLYVSRRVLNADEIIEWFKAQGVPTTLPAEDMHVTVAYSRAPVSWTAAGDSFDQLRLRSGMRSVEKLGDQGATVLKIESGDLQARWQQFVDAGASWDYDSYNPHITITYSPDVPAVVRPWTGPILLGAERFEALDTEWADRIVEKGEGFTPPGPVRSAAKRGLELRRKWGRGGITNAEASEQGIGSGVQRASNLANGSALSLETVKRMAAFFSRHQKNYRPGEKESDGGPTAGTIAWLLWGGNAGRGWADGVIRREEEALKKAKALPTKEQSAGKPGAWQFQERWPGGTALGGQWKAMGPDGITAPPKIAGGLTGSNSIYQKVANAVHDAAQVGDVAAADKAVVKYVDATLKYKTGVKSSHVKWGAQVAQYAAQVKYDMQAKTKASAIADKLNGPQKLSIMTPIGAKPGGSNPGGMYSDSSGKWLVKGSNISKTHGPEGATLRSQNEVLASKLMLAVGAGAPEMKLVDLEGKHGGGVGVASKWIDGGSNIDLKNPAHLAAAQADFAVHAWLGNYDVIGPDFANTKIINGKAVNIDPGGALLYRAQGMAKGDAFGNTAYEFDSLRKPVPGIPINDAAHAVYGSMTASQIAASAEKLKAIDDATIGKLVQAYAPGDDYAKGVLTAKLLARKNDILAKAAALNPPATAAKPSVAAPPPAAPAPAVPAPASKITVLAEKVTFVGGGSDKFWQVAVVGTKVVTQYGKNGTQGQQSSKDMGTTAAAVIEAGKLYESKKAKGYVDAGMVEMEADAPAKPAAKPAAPSARASSILSSTVAEAPKQAIPVFNSGFPETDDFYAGVASKISTAKTVSELEAIKAGVTSKTVWANKTKNSKVMVAHYEQALANLKQTEAANVMAAVAAAQEALSKPVAAPAQGKAISPNPAMPYFNAFKLPESNTNAASNNAKIDKIADLASKGDVKGLLSLNFGSNVYAKKHVKLTNDALKALGSDQTVSVGQKANSHPALFGGSSVGDVAAASGATGKPMPAPHPASPAKKIDLSQVGDKPVFITSNLAVKKENEGHADALYSLAAAGDLQSLKQYDKFNLKSQKLTEFKEKLVNEIEAQLFPPRPKSGLSKNVPPIPVATSPGKALAAHAQYFPPVKITEIGSVASHHRAAGYIIVGKTDASTVNSAFQGSGTWTGKISASLKKKHNDHIDANLSSKDKANIRKYTTNWAYQANDTMRVAGKVTKEIAEVSASIHRSALELPEGSQYARAVSISGSALKQIQALQPGDVIQSPQFESVKQKGGYGESKNVELRLVAASGVKGLWLDDKLSAHSGELEVMMPENARYAINRVYTQGSKTIVEAVILPTVKGTLQ